MAAVAACGGASGDHRATQNVTPASDGEAASAEVSLDGFDEVSLRGPDNVEITLGDAFSVRAEGNQDVLERLEFEVRRGTLRIGRDDRRSFNIGRGNVATIFVTMPAINGASVAGSGDMQIDRAEAEEFEVSVAGSGNIEIAALTATSVEFDIAGSGDVNVAGTAQDIAIGIAGSGNVEAGELEGERLRVRIAGSGDVEAYATETANARLVGSGDVRVRGGAECSSRSLGSGQLRCI
jgi:hypothetical protein